MHDVIESLKTPVRAIDASLINNYYAQLILCVTSSLYFARTGVALSTAAVRFSFHRRASGGGIPGTVTPSGIPGRLLEPSAGTACVDAADDAL